MKKEICACFTVWNGPWSFTCSVLKLHWNRRWCMASNNYSRLARWSKFNDFVTSHSKQCRISAETKSQVWDGAHWAQSLWLIHKQNVQERLFGLMHLNCLQIETRSSADQNDPKRGFKWRVMRNQRLEPDVFIIFIWSGYLVVDLFDFKSDPNHIQNCCFIQLLMRFHINPWISSARMLLGVTGTLAKHDSRWMEEKIWNTLK